MDSLRRVLNYDEEAGILQDLNEASTLSYSTRFKGFLICFLLGIFLSIIAGFTLAFGIKPFAILYTLGNILSIGSTMFLVGPIKQVKNILAPTRLIASIVVLLSFIMTLVAVYQLKNTLLAILMLVIQSLALMWYSISYIPFARDLVMKCLKCAM